MDREHISDKELKQIYANMSPDVRALNEGVMQPSIRPVSQTPAWMTPTPRYTVTPAVPQTYQLPPSQLPVPQNNQAQNNQGCVALLGIMVGASIAFNFVLLWMLLYVLNNR